MKEGWYVEQVSGPSQAFSSRVPSAHPGRSLLPALEAREAARPRLRRKPRLRARHVYSVHRQTLRSPPGCCQPVIDGGEVPLPSAEMVRERGLGERGARQSARSMPPPQRLAARPPGAAKAWLARARRMTGSAAPLSPLAQRQVFATLQDLEAQTEEDLATPPDSSHVRFEPAAPPQIHAAASLSGRTGAGACGEALTARCSPIHFAARAVEPAPAAEAARVQGWGRRRAPRREDEEGDAGGGQGDQRPRGRGRLLHGAAAAGRAAVLPSSPASLAHCSPLHGT